MISEQIIDFVKKQQKLGVSRESIRNILTGQGMTASDVSQVFGAIDIVQPAPPVVPVVPKPPVETKVESTPAMLLPPTIPPGQRGEKRSFASYLVILLTIIVLLVLIGLIVYLVVKYA